MVERRTRIWVGLGTALLVGGSGADRPALSAPAPDPSPAASPARAAGILLAQAGEGGPGEGGGPVIGTITEFRLSSSDPAAFLYDGAAEVAGYVALAADSYAAAHAAATALLGAVEALRASPSDETLAAARTAWLTLREKYRGTEAFLFYAGPVDGPGGPFPRLAPGPVKPALIDGLLADPAQPLDFRTLARLNSIEPPVKVTTGLGVIEYLLWGGDGALGAGAFAGEAGARRGAYAGALARLLANDLGMVAAAWTPGANNYRASVEAMDQRNALGRAFNGITVLVGYEIPLRRIGAGLFPANRNLPSSPFSRTSAEDNAFAFAGARRVYEGTGIDALLRAADPALAGKVAAGFARAEAALGEMGPPYERFLAPPLGSPERATAEAAVRALTDLALDLRSAGNRLGVLVVVPGM